MGAHTHGLFATVDMTLAQARRKISAATGKKLDDRHVLNQVSAQASSEVVTLFGPLRGEKQLWQFGVQSRSVLSVEPALTHYLPAKKKASAQNASAKSKGSSGRKKVR